MSCNKFERCYVMHSATRSNAYGISYMHSHHHREIESSALVPDSQKTWLRFFLLLSALSVFVQAQHHSGGDAAVRGPPAAAHCPPQQVYSRGGGGRPGRQQRSTRRRQARPLRSLAGVQHVPGSADPRPAPRQPGTGVPLAPLRRVPGPFNSRD
jgi:hypothetical protein